MIKNLWHALLGVAAIVVTGWVLAQSSVQKAMDHQKYGHLAAGGVLAGLAVIVVVSLALAARRSKPEPVHHAYPFARRK
jgi:hypothetical protein